MNDETVFTIMNAKISFAAIAVLLASIAVVATPSAFAQTTTTTVDHDHFHHFFGGGLGFRLGLGLGGGFATGFGFHSFAHPFFFGNHFFRGYTLASPAVESGNVIVSCPAGSTLVDNQCVIPQQVITQPVAPTTTILTQSGEQESAGAVEAVAPQAVQEQSTITQVPSSVVVPSSQVCATGTISAPVIVSTGTFGGLFGGFDQFHGFHIGHFHHGDHVTAGTAASTTAASTGATVSAGS